MKNQKIQTSKENVLKQYFSADENQKKILVNIFGAKMFTDAEAKKKKEEDAKKKKEFDYRTITSFEAACKRLKISTKVNMQLGCEEMNKSSIAYYKLCVIIKAINNGWICDFTNDEYKYWNYWYVTKQDSSFGVSFRAAYALAPASVGSRLLFKTREMAEWVAAQPKIKALYEEYFTISKIGLY